MCVTGVHQHERGIPEHPKIVMIGRFGFWQTGDTTRRKRR
ncbi:hypothetical protein OPIT5_11235 [Opitutaceae bacterium TAV5]|nr:hypothetical protein OPIT5_11235 [Opitutaceae bacterium TAV5]